MPITPSPEAVNASVAAVAALVDSAGAGRIEVRTGTKPATPHDAATGTLLAAFTLQVPAFWPTGERLAGQAVMRPVDPVTAVGSGTAGWFRLMAGDGTPIFDGTIGTYDEDWILDPPGTAVGQSVTLDFGELKQNPGY